MSSIDFSNPMVIAALAVVVLAIIVAIAIAVHKRNTSAHLRTKFGPEYERAVLEHGSERKAEAVLAERETRVSKLKLRELGAAQRDRYIADWNIVQSRFVDHPRGAVIEADELVTSLMRARGYPVTGFEQGAEDISVDYPGMTESYRSAHAVATLSARGEASTEELRNAMIHYRSLFDELAKADTAAVETRPAPPTVVPTHSMR
jgi:hypothetical protein